MTPTLDTRPSAAPASEGYKVQLSQTCDETTATSTGARALAEIGEDRIRFTDAHSRPMSVRLPSPEPEGAATSLPTA